MMYFVLEAKQSGDFEEVAIYSDARDAWQAYLSVDAMSHRIRVIAA